ncbi:histone deacetylase family protein [bacterium]|nr:histone deacetylase family protein [bacterium]
MMKPALITHDISARHDVPAGHPERPERYAAILDHIGDNYRSWQRAAAPLAERSQLELVHSESYLDMVFDVTGDADEPAPLDADTWASKRGYECASRAAGGACLAVDMVMENKASTAFSLMRPPGHHAEPEQAMGFCLFSSAAIAARHAQQKWGLNRIAVIDFDVHHGNGTQACFWNDGSLFYASSHQMPLFPGTGAYDETGAYQNIFNLPLAYGTGGSSIRSGWRDDLLPSVVATKPDLIIISAGFDAHEADPLGGLQMTSDDFGILTNDIIDAANEAAEHSGAVRVVSLLEGGYDLNALGQSVCQHMTGLEGI